MCLNKLTVSCKINGYMRLLEGPSNLISGTLQIRAGAESFRDKAQIYATIYRLNKHPENLPQHVLLVPDKNRHWAKAHGVENAQGHEAGAESAEQGFIVLSKLRIPHVTGWVASSDNMEGRSPEEIQALTKILIRFSQRITPHLVKNNGRFVHLGRKDRLDPDLLRAFEATERATAHNTGQILRIAADYGWVDENVSLLRGFKERILQEGMPDEITPEFAYDLAMSTRTAPPIDLIIRPGGEQRTSGFGPLVDYAEFSSLETQQPDMKPIDYLKPVVDFTKRERRFGK